MAKIITYFCRKLNTFFLRPARELIFSLKNSYLKLITVKHHPFPGKNIKVEKTELKVTKNRFFVYEILTTFRNSFFLPQIMKITATKYTMPETP